MSWKPSGKHFISGQWMAADATFRSDPAHGEAHEFFVGTVELVERACVAAAIAAPVYAAMSREERATFLDTIAEEIDYRADAITRIGSQETGLPEARLIGERGRTTGQLKLFADHIRRGAHLDVRVDAAQPDRKPAGRPEIRLVQRPVGPVAVFGASNFPLAFSTAGGDTAAALAAGCPVVVKGHSAHPGTGEIVAEAVAAAASRTGMPDGVFSLIQGGRRDVGTALATHPAIKAVGFTGSLAGGRALFDLCASRPEPIPFFGELGSVNPMFILANAAASRADSIGAGWAASLTLGAGQFCTNPGIVVLNDGGDADRFTASARAALQEIGPQTMLTNGIASAYRDGVGRIKTHNSVKSILETDSVGREAMPNLFETTGDAWLGSEALGDEVFGPLGLVVRVRSNREMKDLAQAFHGQLTATIHMDDADLGAAKELLSILEQKAGRVLVNGFPTGVEVVDSMVHGGPYPASTNFGATSVGTLSIRRFLRPVAYQNFPEELLPQDLRN